MPIDEQGREYYYTSDKDGVPVINYGAPPAAPEVSTSDQLKQLVAKYNPLMLRKSLQEASGAVAGGMALPIVAPISAGVQNLYNKYIGGNEAKSPSVEELMQKYGQAIQPKTELGREMAEGVGKAFQASKLEGLMGMHPTMARGLEPNDVRVMHGQVKQLAKEIRETPADFQAAQSGLKRQNLYGEDTLGVKAQAAADSLAETLERRKASGLSAVPGLPEVLQPETKMYAVRPAKTRMTRPDMPESAKGFSPEIRPIEDLIEDVYGDTPAEKMPARMVRYEYGKRYLDNPDYREFMAAAKDFGDQKLMQRYPDAPDLRTAYNAHGAAFYDPDAMAQEGLNTIEEFMATPEGQALKERHDIPTPSEFKERYKAAETVIKGPYANFISRGIGAEKDPATLLARKGVTIMPSERIKEVASDIVNKSGLAEKRLKAGFPAMGSFHEERLAKTAELDALNEEIRQLEEIRQPLFEQAHEEGVDPASFPAYAETTRPLQQKAAQREKLQKDLDNIKTAQNVEDINDSIIKLQSTEQMLNNLPYEQRQFYPSLTKAKPEETHYTARKAYLNEAGYTKLGEDLVSDILAGKAGDTKNFNIEKYIQNKHEQRVKEETAAQEQKNQYIKQFDAYNKQRIQSDPRAENLGSAAVITLDKNTPKDVALRDVSADTDALNICIGEGCMLPSTNRNIFTGLEQRRGPIINPATGERFKHAREDAYSSYVNYLERGDELARFMDPETGRPAGVLQLIKNNTTGKFDIAYASGYNNGSIDSQYVPAIRDYLNSRADSIGGPGPFLSENTGIYDTANPNDWQRALNRAGLSRDQAIAIEAQDDLPRFVTADDLVKATEGFPVSTAVATREAAPLMQLTIPDYHRIVGDFSTALDNAASSALENSNIDNPVRVERTVHRVADEIFNAHMNDPEGFISEPVARLNRVNRALEDRIANLEAQGNEFDFEVAQGLSDLQVDVRGMLGDLERRERLAQERAVEQRPAQTPALPRAGGENMPNMSADDLLAAHGDRMTDEQRNWLQNFVQNWDMHVDDTPAGQGLQEQLTRLYENWRNENRLGADPLANLFDDIQPDNTHPANNVALQVSPERQNELYRNYIDNFNRDMDEGRIHEEWTPEELADFIRGDDDVGTRNITQVEREALANLVEEFGLRDNFDPAGRVRRGQAAPRQLEAPAPRQLEAPPAVREATQLMERSPVPREVQTMAQADLQRGMTNADIRRAQEIADQMFRQNTFNEEMPIGAATNMLRNHEAETWRGANNYVREQAARHLEQMYATAQHDGHQVTEALDEIFYQDADDYQASISAIEGDIQMLRAGGENAWEDLLGPMAEDITWNPTIQQIVIDGLENLINRYENRIRGYAKGGMVKKQRTTPLVASRKNPELAEMTYRYGGMVK